MTINLRREGGRRGREGGREGGRKGGREKKEGVYVILLFLFYIIRHIDLIKCVGVDFNIAAVTSKTTCCAIITIIRKCNKEMP